jgi:hypothetical protein
MNVDNRIMSGLIKKIKLSPFAFSVFILLLALFVVKNMDILKENSEINSINTRHKQGLNLPTTKLSKKKLNTCSIYDSTNS